MKITQLQTLIKHTFRPDSYKLECAKLCEIVVRIYLFSKFLKNEPDRMLSGL